METSDSLDALKLELYVRTMKCWLSKLHQEQSLLRILCLYGLLVPYEEKNACTLGELRSSFGCWPFGLESYACYQREMYSHH